MKTANVSSATSSTATTSNSAPANKPNANGNNKPAAPKPGEPAPKHDEAAFLAQQAADAKAAISDVLSDLRADLAQAANPGYFMKKYPWLTLGASAVAGFAATAALVPSKEEQALKKLARIERALNPAGPPKKRAADEDVADGDGSPDKGAKGYKQGRTSIGRAILGELIKAVQPAILSMLTAGVTAKVAQPDAADLQAAAQAQSPGDTGP
jgi:hypothetical protein